MLTKIQNAAVVICEEEINGLTCRSYQTKVFVPARNRAGLFSGFSVVRGRSVDSYSRRIGNVTEQMLYENGWVTYLRCEWSPVHPADLSK